METADEFISRVRSVVGNSENVALHEPEITEIEHRYVKECLDSGFVSSVGPFVTQFEKEIADFTGAKHAIAVSNGTSALHIALILAGVKPGDEVIIPALSFVATANAVVHAGAIPHFVDSDQDHLGMSPEALLRILSGARLTNDGLFNAQTGNKITAVVPMHTLGHPARIEEIVSVANQYNLPVVEDAAESLGSFQRTKHTGTFGICGILSFNGNKTITTGGGGMILTDDDRLAQLAKDLTTTAKIPHPWRFSHSQTAWNFRLPNLNAALGVAQLSRLPELLEKKKLLAMKYQQVFADSESFRFISEPPNATSNYWLSSLRMTTEDPRLLDTFLAKSNDNGLQCRPLWDLLCELPMYSNHPAGDISVAKTLRNSVISLPSSPALVTTEPL